MRVGIVLRLRTPGPNATPKCQVQIPRPNATPKNTPKNHAQMPRPNTMPKNHAQIRRPNATPRNHAQKPCPNATPEHHAQIPPCNEPPCNWPVNLHQKWPNPSPSATFCLQYQFCFGVPPPPGGGFCAESPVTLIYEWPVTPGRGGRQCSKRRLVGIQLIKKRMHCMKPESLRRNFGE